jgi:hypothetical protein
MDPSEMNTETTLTTPVPELTDYQLLELAETLIKRADVYQYLPRNYTLMQLYEASKMVHQAGMQLMERYGERLRLLDAITFRELESWKDVRF